MPPTKPIRLPQDCQVELLTEPGATVVAVSGEVDLSTERLLRETLDRALAAPAPVLVDLCGCTFIDSSGLGALLAGVRAARASGQPLAVACEPGGAVRAMVLMVMGPAFSTCASRAAGLAALADGAG